MVHSTTVKTLVAGLGLVGLLGSCTTPWVKETTSPVKAEDLIQKSRDKYGCIGVSRATDFERLDLLSAKESVSQRARMDFARTCFGIPEGNARFFIQGVVINYDYHNGTAIAYCPPPEEQVIPCWVKKRD